MLKLEDYLEKPSITIEGANSVFSGLLGQCIEQYSLGLDVTKEKFDLALIGVPESRVSDNHGAENAPDEVRKRLYSLFSPNQKIKVVDLGNFKRGHLHSDTIVGLTDVLYFLLKQNITPIIIGGTQDLTFSNYAAYELLEQSVSIVSVDNRFDIGNSEMLFDNKSYLSKILFHDSKYLFNFSNIAYQTYFVSEEEIQLFDDLGFERYRLGVLRDGLNEVEPVLRDADIVSIDIGAVRFSDAPGNKQASPNGLFGHDLCQLSRFAGMSDKVSSFGIYEVNPAYDINSQTSYLAAQSIWHFIEGYYLRKNDFPFCDISEYTKFVVTDNKFENEFVFYKSGKSERWWLEIPASKTKQKKKTIIACASGDYKLATRNEIPERYMRYCRNNN